MDYDQWAKLGNDGWSYKDVLPYFKKSENMLEPKAAQNKYYHSVGGPVSIDYPPYRTKAADLYLEAAKSIGFNTTSDFNGDQMEAFGKFHYTARNGRRVHTGTAFLKDARERCKQIILQLGQFQFYYRANLMVLLHATVDGILLEGNVARGVRIRRFGKTFKVRATREVILSAGALVSPQILMLSGIGPKEHLREHGIPVIADLPVGLDMESHYGFTEPVILLDKPLNYNAFSTLSPLEWTR